MANGFANYHDYMDSNFKAPRIRLITRWCGRYSSTGVLKSLSGVVSVPKITNKH